MRTKLTLGKGGRIALPKQLLDQLKLSAGATLRIESDGECITLRPISPKVILKKGCGIWVYQGPPTNASIPELLERSALKRLLLGPGPRVKDMIPRRGRLQRRPVGLE